MTSSNNASREIRVFTGAEFDDEIDGVAVTRQSWFVSPEDEARHDANCADLLDDSVDAAVTAAFNGYKARWPKSCACCGGHGILTSYDSDTGYDDSDWCPDCSEKSLCPRCGEHHELWDEDTGEVMHACPSCGWTGQGADDCNPGWLG